MTKWNLRHKSKKKNNKDERRYDLGGKKDKKEK